MIRTLPGAFRVNGNSGGLNASDQNVSTVALQSKRSQGVTIIEDIDLSSPSPMRTPEIISIAVQGYLGITLEQSTFGKWGKVKTGLVLNAGPSRTTSGGTAPWVNPVLPLPQDPTLVTDLWDPARDELPPVFQPPIGNTSPAQLLPISAVIIPSVPIALPGGQQISLGIWLEPFLMGCITGVIQISMNVLWATYNIVYDDGR